MEIMYTINMLLHKIIITKDLEWYKFIARRRSKEEIKELETIIRNTDIFDLSEAFYTFIKSLDDNGIYTDRVIFKEGSIEFSVGDKLEFVVTYIPKLGEFNITNIFGVKNTDSGSNSVISYSINKGISPIPLINTYWAEIVPYIKELYINAIYDAAKRLSK